LTARVRPEDEVVAERGDEPVALAEDLHQRDGHRPGFAYEHGVELGHEHVGIGRVVQYERRARRIGRAVTTRILVNPGVDATTRLRYGYRN
jgi:hypothetical protein